MPFRSNRRQVDDVLISFSLSGMRHRTLLEELAFDIMLGLRKGLALCRGMRRQLDEEQQKTVSRKIAEQLDMSNWRIERGPPLPDHSTRDHMPPAETKKET